MNVKGSLPGFKEESKMEPETVGKLVQGSLKSKLRDEAVDLHFLPKTATIPGL